MISVVIPTYNRSALLARAINSVLKQSFTHWELWIVDDGSTDNTFSLVKEVISQSPQHRIHYIKTPNLGVSHARNTGIQLARGSWVALLDSDDEWLPHKLELQWQKAQETQAPLIHGHEIWIRNQQEVPVPAKYQKKGGRVFKQCCELCCIGPSTTLIQKSIFDEVGLFNTEFKVCEDFDLWLKICAHYEVALVNENLIYKYGGHPDQLSTQFHSMDEWRLKALLPHIDSPYISPAENDHLKQECLKKGQILLRGLLKHGHTQQHQVWKKRLNESLGVRI